MRLKDHQIDRAHADDFITQKVLEAEWEAARQSGGGLLGTIHTLFHGSDLGCAYGGMTCPQRLRLQQLLDNFEIVSK